mmetsp:Transcript_37490/g.116514  ORF Transcript_37490/g.116514 Transcript_37490/m.116514 type:complete len:108 (+) Transcript_37490:819-1142(+)
MTTVFYDADQVQQSAPSSPSSPATSLQDRFRKAQRDAVTKLRDNTPDDMKFQLYGFYRQARDGDIIGERPNIFNHRERAKYDAWARNRGMSEQQAIESYIKAVAMVP